MTGDVLLITSCHVEVLIVLNSKKVFKLTCVGFIKNNYKLEVKNV